MSTAESLDVVSSFSIENDTEKSSSPSISSLRDDTSSKSSDVDDNVREAAVSDSPESKQNTTEPESLSQISQRPKSHHPSTPTELKIEILKNVNHIWDLKRDLYRHSVRIGHLPVLRLKTAKCSLCLDSDVLEHDIDGNYDDDSYYCELGCFGSGSQNGAFKSQLPKHKAAQTGDSDGDIFLPLGWLVKDATEEETRYVCALNISTNPTSMWLIYDYFGDGELGPGPYWMLRDPSNYDKERKLIHAKRDCLYEFDIALLYEDVLDWQMGHIATSVSSLQEKGDELRARPVKPPKELLQAI